MLLPETLRRSALTFAMRAIYSSFSSCRQAATLSVRQSILTDWVRLRRVVNMRVMPMQIEYSGDAKASKDRYLDHIQDRAKRDCSDELTTNNHNG
jgi:hypothetical protein